MHILIQRAAVFMPGIEKCLRPVYDRCNYKRMRTWDSEPHDIVFGETKNYRVVVVKWIARCSHPHNLSTYYEWLKVCYTKKSVGKMGRMVRKFNTPRICTWAYKNAGFEYAGLDVLKGDKIKVSGRDCQSRDCLTYYCDLSNLILKNSNNL